LNRKEKNILQFIKYLHAMKKAIVVGASSGIGRGLAELLAANGYQVAITGRRYHLLEEIRNQHPGKFIISSFDVTHSELVENKLEELVKILDGLDLFIISAGGGDLNEGLDFAIEKKMINLNVSAFTQMADWVYRYFRSQGYGHLVAISSIAGLRGLRHAPAYNATKAYQISYLEALRQKSMHLKLPITVTDIRPGFVDTPNAKGEGRFWQSSVQKASRQIFKAIKSEKKVAYITKRWWLIAMAMKAMPKFLYDRV
jgi:short-subunit dehydrogenase